MILSTIGHVIGVAVTTAALSLSGNAVAMTSTDAHCISARHHTHSAQAKGCRENGWVIRPRIVVGPYGHVRFNHMPPCRYEDGTYPSASPRHNHIGMQRHCFWNAQERGNGRGDSYYIDHPGSPHWYTTDITWVL